MEKKRDVGQNRKYGKHLPAGHACAPWPYMTLIQVVAEIKINGKAHVNTTAAAGRAAAAVVAGCGKHALAPLGATYLLGAASQKGHRGSKGFWAACLTRRPGE